MSILRNMARRNTQSLTCCCSPGSLWAKAEGIEEVVNSNRGNETTFVQLNPISFPGIKTSKGMILRPENVARQVSVIHCIPKHISQLVSFLILLPWDGKCIPTLGSTSTFIFDSCLLTLVASRRRLFRSTT